MRLVMTIKKIKEFFVETYYFIRYRVPRLPRHICSEIYWFIQRGKRGYADCDVWDFDHYLTKVIPGALRQLKRISHGYPNDLTPEKWDKILEQIIEGFELAHKGVTTLDDYTKNEKVYKMFRKNDIDSPTKAEVKKVDRGFKLFQKYFGALWD
jgi:hypothetical protein